MKHPVPHLSASSIADWLKCPLLWYGRRVAKWPEPPSPELAMGKAMHAGFEAHHRGQDAETALMRAWQGGLDGLAPPSGALRRAFDALRAYRLANPRDRRDRPEVRFRFNVHGVPVPMVGFIDLLRGNEIQEFKTGRGGWKQDRIDLELQATAYWIAYERLFGFPPERVVYWIVATQPEQREPYRLETTRTREQVEAFEATVRRVWGEMCAADLAAKCREDWCRFGANCEPWRTGDDRSTGPVRTDDIDLGAELV